MNLGLTTSFIIGGLLMLAFAKKDNAANTRFIALAISILTLLLSIPLYTDFDTATAVIQFSEKTPWISSFNINYHLGIDGISMPLIVLTTFMTVIVVISSWEVIKDRVEQYMAAFLIMEGLMVGVFASLDAALFYVFWEAMLIPMFIVIGIWVHFFYGIQDLRVFFMNVIYSTIFCRFLCIFAILNSCSL
jgi:NADH-quinone oxidoreductase subunit M